MNVKEPIKSASQQIGIILKVKQLQFLPVGGMTKEVAILILSKV